jgi:hypothetical protein
MMAHHSQSRMLMVQRLAGSWCHDRHRAGRLTQAVRKWRDRYTAECEVGLPIVRRDRTAARSPRRSKPGSSRYGRASALPARAWQSLEFRLATRRRARQTSSRNDLR